MVVCQVEKEAFQTQEPEAGMSVSWLPSLRVITAPDFPLGNPHSWSLWFMWSQPQPPGCKSGFMIQARPISTLQLPQSLV